MEPPNSDNFPARDFVNDPVSFATCEAFQSGALHVLEGARFSLNLLLERLDEAALNIADISSHITRISRHARSRTDIRILVKLPEPLNPAHPLVALARKLPSVVQVRVLTTQPSDTRMSYLIGDRACLLFRHDSDSYHGYYSETEKPRVVSLLDEFNHLWGMHSAPLPSLRQLYL